MTSHVFMGILLFLLSNSALGQDRSREPLSELALFSRCYAHLTQKSLPLSHPLRAQVKAGTLKAVDACMRVINGVQLIATQPNEGSLVNSNDEAKQVLLNMNDFHRSWFPNDNIMKAIPFLEDFNYQPYIHDEQEAGLHVTRVLLTNGLRFSEIVTGNSAMEALRSIGPSPYDRNALNGDKLQQWSTSVPNAGATRVNWNPPLVQTGELLGVRRLSLNTEKINLVTNSLDGTEVANRYFGSPGPLRPNEAHGGGIIGTPSYLLLNLGRPDTGASDGGLVMNRRWAKAVYSDVLCRELPAVRITDATPLIQTVVTALTPPFRKAGSCMSCHSSMDGMASVARNISYATNSYVLFGGTVHTRKWAATQPAENGFVDADSSYFQRPTNGKLYYRSYNGNLIDRQVSSLATLGEALSETEDLYVCTAAKYFQFFTGIKVNLQDPGDTSLPALSSSEKSYRDIVIKLGLDLKNSQNLKALIQSIFSSDLYRSSAQRL
ncbi:MAG: hypothetical protein SGJ18_03870 [Pseudomonadota bacterium]|nr:hypothetical protein [Pseudomonadota bacterium]